VFAFFGSTSWTTDTTPIISVSYGDALTVPLTVPDSTKTQKTAKNTRYGRKTENSKRRHMVNIRRTAVFAGYTGTDVRAA